ncbi:MAG TPA: hypothetical protein VK363_01640 [Pyrinomonadaceae bacterium]|nr:hypothetical protein [Pyrinomonadaceae bacterium]
MLVLAVVVLAGLSGWGGGKAQSSARVNWEYKIVTKYGVTADTGQLNQLGAEGWELVLREESGFERSQRRIDYYFKRAK